MTKSDTNFFTYLPIANNPQAAGFFLTGVGKQSVSFSDSRNPPKHPDIYSFTWDSGRVLPEYQLVYLHDGAGEFESFDTGRVNLQPGTAIILIPDVWHRYRPRPGSVWVGYWISFDGDIPHIWQRSGAINARKAICAVTQPQAVTDILARIVEAGRQSLISTSPAASFDALALLAMILGDMARNTANTQSGQSDLPLTDDALVNSAIRLMWNHSHRGLTVSGMARQLHTTCRTLERRFLAVRKRRVFEELTDCRLIRARRMLRETHLPIKRIAYITGFTSSTHMLRVFQRKFGFGPMEFRNSDQH